MINFNHQIQLKKSLFYAESMLTPFACGLDKEIQALSCFIHFHYPPVLLLITALFLLSQPFIRPLA